MSTAREDVQSGVQGDVPTGGWAGMLPFVGRTEAVSDDLKADHWNAMFGQLWGAQNLRALHRDGQIKGSLHSRRIGALTFNRIEFGNQQFERARSRRDAAAIGLDPDRLRFGGAAVTANGRVRTAAVTIDSFAIGDTVERDIPAVVIDSELQDSLLGMSYLRRFTTISFQGDTLILER